MAYSEASNERFNAPVFLGDLFSGGGGESSSDEEEREGEERHVPRTAASISSGLGLASKNERAMLDQAIDGRMISPEGLRFEVTSQEFPFTRMQIRQFDDHVRNANICWPEARCLAEWLVGEHLKERDEAQRKERFDDMMIGFSSGRAAFLKDAPIKACPPPPLPPFTCPDCGLRRKQKRVFELGAATGALAIFLATHGVDVHTSDYDDVIVTENIAENWRLNGFPPSASVHLQHSWGIGLEKVDAYVRSHGAPDVILGSDILAYEDDFGALADTIERLMPLPLAASTTPTAAVASPNDPAVPSSVAPVAAVSAVPARFSSSPCSACHPPAVLLMCWKRSHNKKLLDDGFWRVMHERGFNIETRGNKTYEIRRGKRECKPGQYVKFVKS